MTQQLHNGEFIRKIIPVIRSLFIAFIDTDIEFDIIEINFDIDRIFCIPQGHVFFLTVNKVVYYIHLLLVMY